MENEDHTFFKVFLAIIITASIMLEVIPIFYYSKAEVEEIREEAYDIAYEEAYELGCNKGYEVGFEDGLSDSRIDIRAAYIEGYDAGYYDGENGLQYNNIE